MLVELKNNRDKNLECVGTKLKELKRLRFRTSWENLENLEKKITHYENLLLKGILYEPRF